MRYLDKGIILQTVGLLILILGVLIYNVYIATSRKIKSFHVTSFFIEGFLFCMFMQVILLDLTIERTYVKIGWVALAGSILSGIWLTIDLLRQKGIKPMPKMPLILTALEDISVVIDDQGKVVDVHLPMAQSDFFGKDCQSIQELGALMGWDIRLSEQMEREFFDCIQLRYFQVSATPIRGNGRSSVGMVLLFQDITNEKSLYHEMSLNNQLLKEVNVQLKDYVEVVCALETEKVRLKLIEEIQSELLNRIERVIEKMSSYNHLEHFEVVNHHLALDISEELRDIMRSIRCAVKKISVEREECGD